MITEKNFDPNKHVIEYKRVCRQCRKVWHSLATREVELQTNECGEVCWSCVACGDFGAQWQRDRKQEAKKTDLNQLKTCPECGSGNYTEEKVFYEKK